MVTPSVRVSKWPQLRQNVHDVNKFMTVGKKLLEDEEAALPTLDMSVNKKSFQAAQTCLPQEVTNLLKDTGLAKSYKKAGVESNQRSAAATAWIVEHAPANNWALSPMAWAGCMGPKSFPVPSRLTNHIPQLADSRCNVALY